MHYSLSFKPEPTPVDGDRRLGKWRKLFSLTAMAAIVCVPASAAAQATGAGSNSADSVSTRSIEDRIQRLEDIEAIRALRYRYHHYINDGLDDRAVDLFTKDGVLEVEKVQSDTVERWEGADAIRAGIVRSVEARTLVKQFNHNLIVDVNGDKATGISYFELRYAENGVSLMIAGRYSDEYVRTDGHWLISRQNIRIDFAVPVEKGWAGPKLNYLGDPD